MYQWLSNTFSYLRFVKTFGRLWDSQDISRAVCYVAEYHWLSDAKAKYIELRSVF